MERASEVDSMINEEEECEIDLLSNSDYAIGTVSENILRKRGEEININRASTTFQNPRERPQMYITNQLIVGDEDLGSDSTQNPNNNMEIQTINLHIKHSLLNFQ